MKRQILLGVLILLFIQTLAVAGDTYYVPSRDYPTIQDAIDAAAFANDDVVVVAPGVYTGHDNVNLDFGGRAITVKSEINPDNPNPAIIAATIIDCGGEPAHNTGSDTGDWNRAFRFHSGEGPNSKVLGFTIRNGYARGPKGADGVFGYDGFVDATHPISLFIPIPPCAVDDPNNCPPYALNGANRSGHGYGGAILCESASSPTIQYCVIRDCTVTGAQGGDGARGNDGIWYHWTLGDIDPCTGFTDPNNPPTENPDGQWGGSGGRGSGNGYGGAIACRGNSNPIISDCIISDNFARGGCSGDGGRGGNAVQTDPPDYDGLEGGGGDANKGSVGDGMGGGIYSDSGSSPVITNCTFSNDIATTGIRSTGGERGLGNEDDPRAFLGLDGVVYSTGGIAGGAAYYNTNSHANFTNCTFTSNKAYEAKRYKQWVPYPPYPGEDISAYTVGGALYSLFNSGVNLDTCEFIGNLGGAVYCGTGCNLDFDDCLFSDNSETANGGAVYIGPSAFVDLQGCIFGGNSAYDDGGALKCRSNITLTNCSFGNNIADSDDDDYGYGGAMDAYQHGTTLIINVSACSFAGNQSVYGGGFSSESFDATFTDCYFIGNTAQRGGGLDLVNGDISVTGGVVNGNNATDGDGGGFNCRYTIAEIRDCTISDNFADGVYPAGGSGGAINFYGWAPTQVVFNCLLTGNFATINGGAIFCRNVTPEIGNCTFSGNFASDYGGAIFSDWASDPQITDAIFQNNNSHAIHEEDSGGDALVKYSLFYNNPDGDYYDSGTGMTYSGSGQVGSIPGGSNNLYGSPLFESGPLGEFYLNQTSSPAVDSGSVTAVSLGLDSYTTDPLNVLDSGQVDRGYHYIDISDIATFQLTANVIGGHGTVAPTAPPPVDYNAVTDTYTYYAGTVVTLTSEPDSGWRIKAWSGTDDDSSTATINSVVMNSNRTVTVEFELPRTLIVAVGGGEEGFYVNITDALHDAEDGDTIVVYPGVYYGPQVQVNKDVEIRSQNPDDPNWVEQTIIDSTGHAGPVFWFDSGRGPGCILNGFTIQNSTWYTYTGDDGDDPGENGEDYELGAEGGAIWISEDAGPVIKNCVIRDNFILGGFAGSGADADDTHNAGRGGWGGWAYGGAVYCDTNSSPQFINCRIIDNQAVGGIGGNGGDWDPDGGWANYGGNWSRAEWWNRPTDSLEWEWVQGDLWEVWRTTIVEGDTYMEMDPYIGDYRWYSGYGGGVFINEGSNVAFINCTISGNLAQGGLSGLGGDEPGAGPMRAKPFPLQYEIPSFGGGVYCAANSTVTFTGCTITDNVSSYPLFNHITASEGYGGEDDLSGWIQPEYDPCDTYSIDPYLGHGGGVCAEDTATVIFTDCNFSGNKAAVGGGIHGGNANLEVSDCEFVSNLAYQGGGLFGEHGPATILRSNFTDNIAFSDANDPNVLGEGGGIHFWATEADIIDCNISNNQAEASGGGAYFGGEGTSFLTNCLLTENAAGRDGGGVSTNIFSQLTVSNCTIADNIVTGVGYGGGVYGSYGSYTNIVDSIIWGNSADFGPQIGIGITVNPSTVEVSDSDVQGAQSDAYVEDDCTLIWDPNNLYTDPFFVIGPLGDYYLSQTEVDDPNQTVDSPCVDAGSGSAISAGMSGYTTRTDELFDRGIVDMGYHHLITLEVEECRVVDLFLDHFINFKDFTVFAWNWLRDDCSDDNGWCDGADLTFDGNVDWEDLEFYIGCWLVIDNDTPAPNPSEWAIEPYSSSLTSIGMVAETTIDTWGGDVEYYFECVYGDCSDSGWQSELNYTDSGLNPNTEYGYRVRAKDSRCGDISDLNCTFDLNDPNDPNAPNKTDWSDIRYAITSEGECYAVICGISNTIPYLPFSVNDAVKVYERLVHSANWNPEADSSPGNIVLLTDSSATKAAIHAEIQNMATKLGGGDLFLFYFSNHGTTGEDVDPIDEADGLDEYLVPYGGVNDLSNCIRDDELGDWLAEVPTDNYIVLLDACFSGGHAKDGLAPMGLGDNVPAEGDGFAEDLLRITGRVTESGGIHTLDLQDNGVGVVLTATDEGELGWQAGELEHSVFTYYLLEAMDGIADQQGNDNGWVSGEECYDYLAPKVNTYVQGFGEEQHPQLYDADLVNELEFLFLELVSPGTPAAPAVLGAWAVSSSQIDLAWLDDADNEDGFEIERRTDGDPFLQIDTVGPGTDLIEYSDTGLVELTTYTYRVRAYNAAGYSPFSNEAYATTFAEGQEPNDPNDPNEPSDPNEPNEPSLQAPVIVSANQVEVGAYWHHVITAQATAEDPLYFRFVCLNESTFNSAWVPRVGPAVETFAHPVLPGVLPDATITRGSGVITYDIAVGVSWNLWQWRVCGSNGPSGVPSLCSAPVAMPPPF